MSDHHKEDPPGGDRDHDSASLPRKPGEAPAQESPPPLVGEDVGEIGGPSGPEPTRYGDWERKGRCIDF